MIELDEDVEPQDPQPVASPLLDSAIRSATQAQPQEPQAVPQAPTPVLDEAIRTSAAQTKARAENDFLTMFGVASETDPTRFAEARDIAKTLGVDPDTALENRDVLRAVWKKRQLESADLARTAPVLAKSLMNAEFARIAHDDVADLGFFEGLWRSWSAGQAETMLGKLGTERMFRGEQPELLAQARNLRRELRHSPPAEGWVWGLARWGGQMSVMIPEAVTYGAAAGATAAGLAGAISGPAAPAAVPAAAAGAFAATFATSMFAQSFQLQGGLDYDQFIQAGYDPKTAFHAAVGSGLVGATLETAGVALQWARPVMQPLKRALAREVGEALAQQTLTKAGLQAGKSYLLGVAGEVTTESLQELTSIFAENVAYKASQNPEADPSTYAKGETWKRLVDVAVSSAQLSLVLGAMPEYARYRYLAMNADRAKATYQTLQQSMETMGASKTMERAPDLATAYLAETLAESKAETLHIDGAAFVKALSQTDKESTESGAVEKSAIEQLSNAFPEIAGQISEAATNGTDVTIPTAVFIEKMSKSPLGAKLIEHARTDAGAPSWAEVQEGVEKAPELVQQLSADIDKRAEEAELFAESASDLERRIRDEIRVSGKIKNTRVADTAAFVARKYYETQAADQGKLPGDLPQISFTGKPVPEGSLQQPAFDSPEFKAWFGESKVVDKEGRPLVVYHGTPTPGFSSFDLGMAGANTGAKSAGMGFFFSAKPETAATYQVEEKRPTDVQFTYTSKQYNDARKVKKAALAPFEDRLDRLWRLSREEQAALESEMNAAWWESESNAEARKIIQVFESEEYGSNLPRPVSVGGLMPVRLSLKNPLVKDYQGAGYRDETYADVIAKAKKMGHDGVILRNTHDGGPVDDIYVAFEPTQIKSVNNRGTFDPNDPNILQQPGRGAYDPNTNTIHLTERSDASSLWHELLHGFFSMMVADPAPTPRVQADLDALFRWFGTDRAGWDAMSQEQREKLHEQLAYNHEVYGYEGKAPSTELQPVFDRMSRWIRDIYKDVNGSLNAAYKKEFGVDLPVLTDDVRRVFGSMIAAQDAIEQAAAVHGQTATFTERSQFSGTDEQWAEYQSLEEARRLGGVSKLTSELLGNIKWLDTRSKALSKEVAAVAKKARAEARKDAEKQVKLEPVYRLRQWLKQGKHKIDSAEAARALGVLAQDRMPGLAPYLSDDGALPDVVAEQQGFTTGEEMLVALADAPELDAAIEARTDELVLQEHGNLQNATDQAIAVQEALNSEAASKLAGFLLKFALGEKRQGRLSRAAIKEVARKRLENTSLRKIDSAAYARAAARAEREASELLRGKRATKDKAATAPNPKEAIAKLQQWALNTELAHQAAKIQKEVNAAKTTAKRFFRPNEKLAKTRVMNLVNAGRAILTAYGIAGGAKLPLSFINQIEKYDPVAYDRIAPLVAEITNNDTLQDYRDLTLEQFRDVIGVTNGLWEGSGRDKHIEVGGKKVLREAAETEMLKVAVASLGPTPTQVGPLTEKDRSALSWSGMKAYVIRVESWAKKLDGGAASGPWQNYIYRQMSNPFTRYMRDRERLVRKMHDLLVKLPMPDGTIDGSSTIGHVFSGMSELLGAMLHTGNQSSLRKLLLGYEWGTESVASGAPVLDRSRWDDFIQQQIAKGRLTKEHFDFVQAMWDLNEELKPIAQKVNKELHEVYFKEIEAQSFETPWGTYRGGYAPAPPDRDHPKNGNMGQRIEADFLRAMENDFRESMPGVNESFTIERNTSTRPLLLDVRLQARHFDQVLRFIHLQQPARDVMKLLNSEKMAAYLAKAQPGVVEQVLVPWLKAVTANRMTTPHESGKLNTLFSTLRRSTGLSFMFLSVRNALQQATGLFNSLVQVKRKHLAAGFWRYHEMGLEKAIEHISQDSVFMQERLQSQLGQLADDIDLILDPSRWGRVKQAINKHGYFLQRMVQNRVDVVTWLGARDQAMASHGNAELAIQEADSAVRLSQGSHTTVDVAKFERSSPFARLFFQFSGYYNTVLNQILVAKGWQQVSKTALLASLAPALASAAIGLGLSLGTEMDDNDEDGYTDEFAWWIGANVLKAGANMVPGFGPAVAQAFTSEKVAGDRVTLAPAAAVVQAAARLVGVFEYQPKRPGAAQIELLGQRFRAGGSQIRDLSLVVSAVTGIPIGFLAKPLAYWRDVATGETEASPLRTAANILGTGR